MITKIALAKKLKTTPIEINLMMVKGMPYMKYGSFIMFDLDKVEKWLKDNKINFKKINKNKKSKKMM